MRISLTGLVLFVAVTASAGGQAVRATVAPTSRLWIEGTSNVHDWKCNAATIDAKIDIDEAGLAAASTKLVRKASIRIPVADLKCGNGKMDDNLRKALSAGTHPDITYTLSTVEAQPGESKDEFILHTVGALVIMGTEKSVTMDLIATRLADGTIKATGTMPVTMTAYGVKPPKAMFGTIKTGDKVKVLVELVVK
ncbi:MAG: YceI family protein [Gemmatimonadaceae bacterium]